MALVAFVSAGAWAQTYTYTKLDGGSTEGTWSLADLQAAVANDGSALIALGIVSNTAASYSTTDGPNYFLSIDNDKVKTLENKNVFTIEPGEGGKYTLKTQDGLYVQTGSNGGNATLGDAANAAQFELSAVTPTDFDPKYETADMVRFDIGGTFLNCQNRNDNTGYRAGVGGFSAYVIWKIQKDEATTASWTVSISGLPAEKMGFVIYNEENYSDGTHISIAGIPSVSDFKAFAVDGYKGEISLDTENKIVYLTYSEKGLYPFDVTSTSQFDGTFACTFTTARGGWTANTDATGVVCDLGTASPSDDPEYQKFAVLELDGALRIYNVKAKKFLNYVSGSNLAHLVADKTCGWTFEEDNDKLVARVAGENIWFNIDGTKRVTLDNWSTHDPGNLLTVSAVEAFTAEQLEEAKTIWNSKEHFTLVYEYYYNGVKFATDEMTIVGGEEYPEPAMFGFADPLEKPEGTVTADDTKTFNVTFSSFPFTVSSNFASATWYTIKMRNNRYAYYAAGNEANEAQTADAISYEDAYQWAFVGTPVSFKIVNKAAGADKAMKRTGELKNVFDSEGTDFVAVEAAAQEDRNIYIKVAGDNNQYINLRNNSMAYWDSSAAKGEIGSAMAFTEIKGTYSYCLDIVGDPTFEATVQVSGIDGIFAPGDYIETSGPLTSADVTATPIEGYATDVTFDEENVYVTYYVNDVTALSNDAVYSVLAYDNNRGGWYFNVNDEEYLNSSVKAGMPFDIADMSQYFAFLKSDSDKYYAYSLMANKFLTTDGSAVPFSEDPTQDVEFVASTGSFTSYPFVISIGGHHVGISNSYDHGVISHYDSTEDGGNCVRLIFAGGSDLSAVVEQVNNYEHGGTTGISGVLGAQKLEGAYDLQGRKVKNAVRGKLYIINGKKVVK